jgi:hypothetical protein
VDGITDDEVVYVMDKHENILLLRNVVAKVLHWFYLGKFSVAQLTYVDNFSNYINMKY